MNLSPVSQAEMIVKESMQYILDPEELAHHRDVERGCFLDKPPALILLQEQYWIRTNDLSAVHVKSSIRRTASHPSVLSGLEVLVSSCENCETQSG